jgi:hypothetical protein
MSMAVHPKSFLVGLATAFIVPALSRVIRPLVVEAAVVGIALVDEGRRVVAEQIEALEDLAAEARARREEMLMASNGQRTPETDAGGGGDDAGAPAMARRRASSGRRRAS